MAAPCDAWQRCPRRGKMLFEKEEREFSPGTAARGRAGVRDGVQLCLEGWGRTLMALVFFHQWPGRKKGAFPCKMCFPSWESEMWRLAWGWEPLPILPGLPGGQAAGRRARCTHAAKSEEENCRTEQPKCQEDKWGWNDH